MKNKKVLNAEIGYTPLEWVGEDIAKIELKEVSFPPSELEDIKEEMRATIEVPCEIDISSYLNNPVVTYNFRSEIAAIGKVTNIKKQGNKLLLDIHFRPDILKKNEEIY